MNKRFISVGEAERLANELLDDESREELYDLAYKLLSQEIIYGSEDDYHNFSLNYSRKSAYDIACDILEKGLLQFPNSVDLLADYLQIGMNCKRFDKCNECYRTLRDVPRKTWTWRGFSFSVEYMIYLCKSLNGTELEHTKQCILELIDEYIVYFPNSEDPYICKADLFSFFNDATSVDSVLRYAVQSISVCPKCSLRLADILVEKGEYEEALHILDECLYKSIQTQDTVNQGYLYYLSGLCKTVILLKSGDFKNRERVVDIYHDFAISQRSGLSQAAYMRVMRRQIDILEIRSGIEYDE